MSIILMGHDARALFNPPETGIEAERYFCKMEAINPNLNTSKNGPGVKESIFYLIVLIAIVPMITGFIGDFFRMVDGDMETVNTFTGEYMAQYSWAELTTGRLVFRIQKG